MPRPSQRPQTSRRCCATFTDATRAHWRIPVPDALIERDGQTMIITMNRPQRMNAISGAMLVRMYDAYVEASNDDDVRCIIVTGAGGLFGRRSPGDVGRRRHRDRHEAGSRGRSRHPLEGAAAQLPANQTHHRRGRGIAIAGGTEAYGHPSSAGESARFVRGPLEPLHDGWLRRAPAPSDPLHARRGDPVDRQTHHRTGRQPSADRSRRARRPGTHQGQGDDHDDLRARTPRRRGSAAHAAQEPAAELRSTSTPTAGPCSPASTPRKAPGALAKRKAEFRHH